ncbi:MAG: protein kinase [Acidobacteriota bacterium]
MLTGDRFGRYEIRGKIGEGGMGEVYAAHDEELDRSVAIKLLPTEFVSDGERRSRFRQEARTASSLNHPNIITIYEIGENEHGSFLATELIDGRTLREVIRSESITLPRILRIIEQTANALVAAHEAKIVHRDIKPENIMVRKDAIVKVLDFGLAKATGVFDNDSLENANTIPGTVMGSARYMSPEQARGHVVDERTDIWSLGVVLYEMLTGGVPFKGETTADTLAAVIYHEPDAIQDVLPNTPSELIRILRKALQKDREERYQSVKDFALDIKDLLHDLEHTTSGNRSGHSMSSPEFSENPTIIHKTISANHPTTSGRSMTSNVAYSQPSPRRSIAVGAAALAGIAVFSLVAFAVYRYVMPSKKLVNGAFEHSQISRMNTDGKVLLPALSPDGKYAAYVSGEIGNQSLVVRQVSTDSTVTVVPATNLNFSAVAFSPSGDRVYYCLTRSDFSINTLYNVPTLGGPSKKLIDDVDSSVTFSPDGKRFAFIRHSTNNNEDIIFTVDTATLDMTELTKTKTTGFDFFSTRPAWSPDGKTILLGAGKRDSTLAANMSVVEVSLEGKTVKTLDTAKFYTVGNFVWFEDGSGFLCSGRETQTSPIQIYRSSYPAIDFQPVTNDFNDYVEIALAADGRTILALKGDTSSSIWRLSAEGKDDSQLTTDSRYLEGVNGIAGRTDGSILYTRKDGNEGDLWTADKDGKNARVWLEEPGYLVSPALTPDGRYVLFAKQKGKISRIWRADADGKNPIQLTDGDPGLVDSNPQITPDGKMVIFQRQTTELDKIALMKVPVDGGDVSPVYASDDFGVFQPRISPDGKHIAFTTFDLKTFAKKLQIASLNGYELGKTETTLDYNLIGQFSWSPDGRSLTVLSSRGGTLNLWRQSVDGSAPTPITNFKTGRVFNFTWAPDGKTMLLARGNTANDLILIRDTAPLSARSDAKTVREI